MLMHIGEAFGNHELQINKLVAPVVPSLSFVLAIRETGIWADAQISNSSLPSSGQYIGQSTNWATVEEIICFKKLKLHYFGSV